MGFLIHKWVNVNAQAARPDQAALDLAQKRSDAAKKAWATRRRNEKLARANLPPDRGGPPLKIVSKQKYRSIDDA